MDIEVGAVLEGKVTGITKFGAFVALEGGKSGLVHISEVANTFVNDVNDFLSVGQTVKVKVLQISQDGKIGLSVKKAEERPANPAASPQLRIPAQPEQLRSAPYVPTKSDDQGFEDKLKQFMQDADKKMSGSRLYEQQRRGKSRRK